MSKYHVVVRETHTFTIEVEANDPDEARLKAATIRDNETSDQREPDSIQSDQEDWDIYPNGWMTISA